MNNFARRGLYLFLIGMPVIIPALRLGGFHLIQHDAQKVLISKLCRGLQGHLMVGLARVNHEQDAIARAGEIARIMHG